MKKIILSAALLGLIADAGGGILAAQGRRGEQDRVREDTRAGKVKNLPEIEARVVPQMGGASYLGPEYDSDSGRYRLKFMRAGSVIWVDVDGHTGAVIGRSGN